MTDDVISTQELSTARPPAGPGQIAPLRQSLLLASAITALWLGCWLWFAFETPRPLPFVHDEFSYLLAADTFAHGRLANPPHPMGKFFESPHILVRPTYVSKYPPGQGLVLGLGERLFGSPFWGIVIQGAAMIFVFTVMLCAWVSIRWAAAISAVIALYFLPPMYWVHSYWGGCVTATGAALVLLGIGRHREGRWRLAGGIVALGLSILFLTRPYEGGIFAIAALGAYGMQLWRERHSGRTAQLAPAVLLAAPILAITVLWTGYYNKATTGNALQMPYMLFEHEYNATPIFWFQPMRPEPHYSHPRLAALVGAHGREAAEWRMDHHGRFPFIHHIVGPLQLVLLVPGPLAALIVLLPLAWRDTRVRMMGFITGACVLSLSPEVFLFSHYAAPSTAPLLVMLAAAAETAGQFRRFRRPVGLILAASILVAGSAAVVIYRVWKLTAAPKNPQVTLFAVPRQGLIDQLSKAPEKQLLIVHDPSPAWNLNNEWVYNGADIDKQHVIFAHDLGPQQNEQLLSYYRGRKAWLLTPNARGYSLAPYAPRPLIPEFHSAIFFPTEWPKPPFPFRPDPLR